MTCDAFLELWNARLDGTASADAAALDLHASSCAGCARLAYGLRILESAPAAPAAPDALTDRILNAWALEASRPALLAFRPARGLAWAGGLAAAALLIAYALRPGPVDKSRPIATIPPALTRPWTSALADATSATLDLARHASAPAARLGQDALVAARSGESAWPVSLTPPTPPSDVFQSVSKSVSSGVRPLSGSARRAFSFLTAPRGSRPAAGDSGA